MFDDAHFFAQGVTLAGTGFCVTNRSEQILTT
jgi:hypothetical protein